MESEAREAAVQSLLQEIIERLEEDPEFDPEKLLVGEPTIAERVRTSLDRLRAGGLLALPTYLGPVLSVLRERQAAPPQVRLVDPQGEACAHRSVGLVPIDLGRRYNVMGEVGEGGMGRVFSAVDNDLQRKVAIKIIKLEGAGTDARISPRISRFVREAQITAQLEHPNIVPVHDLGITAEKQVFLALKLVGGNTMRDLTKTPVGDDEFPFERRIEVVERVCDALAFAHSRGVIHRDLKPSNVMVGSFGEVQLMDWGLARALSGSDDGRRPNLCDLLAVSPVEDTLTTEGNVVGTLGFMSPEQARGKMDAINERTDVFGVGALLYFAMTGQPIHGSSTREEALRKAEDATIDALDLDALGGRVPPEVLAICRRALRKDPMERYPSMEALAADLRAFRLQEKGSAWTDSPWRRAVKWGRRHPAQLTALTSVLLMTLVALSIYALLEVRRELIASSRIDELARIEHLATRVLPRLALKSANEVESTAIRTLRASGGSDELDSLTVSTDEDSLRARVTHFVAAYREVGIPLDSSTPDSTIAKGYGRIAELSPEYAEDVLSGLYDVAVHLGDMGCAGAALVRRGPPSASDAYSEWGRWEAILRTSSDLVELWERLHTILPRLEGGTVSSDVARSLMEWWTEPPEDVEEVMAEAHRFAEGLGRSIAEMVLRFQEPAVATAFLERVCTDSPSLLWPNALLCEIALRAEDHATAVHYASVCCALRPDIVSGWLLLTKATYNGGRLAEALVAAEKAVELDPDFAVPYSNRAVVLLGLGRADEAERDLKTAIALDNDYARAYFHLGLTYSNGDRDLAGAERMLKKAHEVDELYVLPLRHLALLFSRTNRAEEAIELYEEGMRREPDNWHWPNELGALYAKLGEAELEIACYREALRVAPDEFIPRRNLAIALHEQFNLTPIVERDRNMLLLSVEHYRRALEIDPSDFQSRFNLAPVLDHLGQTDEAIDEYATLTRYHPDDYRSWIQMGRVALKARRGGAALIAYRGALELHPEDTWALQGKGMALGLLGRTAEASVCLETVLERRRAAVAENPDSRETYEGQIERVVTTLPDEWWSAQGDPELAERLRDLRREIDDFLNDL